jgi:hypothetical protein
MDSQASHFCGFRSIVCTALAYLTTGYNFTSFKNDVACYVLFPLVSVSFCSNHCNLQLEEATLRRLRPVLVPELTTQLMTHEPIQYQ